MKKILFNLNNNKIIIILLLLLLLFSIFNKNLIEGNSNRNKKCKFDSKNYEKIAEINKNKMKEQADGNSSKDSQTNDNIQAMSG